MEKRKNGSLSKFSDKQLMFYRKVFLLLGAFMIICLLGVFVGSPFGVTHFVFIALAILMFGLSNGYKKELDRRKSGTDETVEPVAKPQVKLDIKVVGNAALPQDEIYEKEHHNIAGTSYRQATIKSLGLENDCYTWTKKELVEYGMEDENIYQLEFEPDKVELIEEPDNEHDPNAIKVIIDGEHVGYIKKGSCSHVKKLIHEDKIAKISAEIHGGKYKRVVSEYDYEKNKDVATLEKGETNFFVSIYIHIKE